MKHVRITKESRTQFRCKMRTLKQEIEALKKQLAIADEFSQTNAYKKQGDTF